jgi:hypothetical protein
MLGGGYVEKGVRPHGTGDGKVITGWVLMMVKGETKYV